MKGQRKNDLFKKYVSLHQSASCCSKSLKTSIRYSINKDQRMMILSAYVNPLSDKREKR